MAFACNSCPRFASIRSSLSNTKLMSFIVVLAFMISQVFVRLVVSFSFGEAIGLAFRNRSYIPSSICANVGNKPAGKSMLLVDASAIFDANTHQSEDYEKRGRIADGHGRCIRVTKALKFVILNATDDESTCVGAGGALEGGQANAREGCGCKARLLFGIMVSSWR